MVPWGDHMALLMSKRQAAMREGDLAGSMLS